MKGHARSLYLTLLLSTITLTACTPHQSSVERHTRHYVYTSDDGFDPNFYVHKTDTTKMLIPFFQHFGIWEQRIRQPVYRQKRLSSELNTIKA